jgi:hypothetical protein
VIPEEDYLLFFGVTRLRTTTTISIIDSSALVKKERERRKCEERVFLK